MSNRRHRRSSACTHKARSQYRCSLGILGGWIACDPAVHTAAGAHYHIRQQPAALDAAEMCHPSPPRGNANALDQPICTRDFRRASSKPVQTLKPRDHTACHALHIPTAHWPSQLFWQPHMPPRTPRPRRRRQGRGLDDPSEKGLIRPRTPQHTHARPRTQADAVTRSSSRTGVERLPPADPPAQVAAAG